MTKYVEGVTGKYEIELAELKQKRYSYQTKIDKAIADLNKWTAEKNSMHFRINMLKRLIRESSKEDRGK